MPFGQRRSGQSSSAMVSAVSAESALLALLICVSAPACNWTTFADDANNAPVRSIGAPGTFKSQDFGRSVLPISDPQGQSAAFIATSINDSSMVLVSLGAGGGVSSTEIPPTALNDTEASEITSLVEVPGTSPLKLLLGTPKIHNQAYGRIYTYLFTPDNDGAVNTLVTPLGTEEPGLGRGLAVGHLAGDAGTLDYVVASDDQIEVVVDQVAANALTAAAEAGCEVTFDQAQDARYLVRRPLLAAHLWDDPAGPVDQLVSGSTHSGTPGKLSFFSASGGSLNCLATVAAPAPKTSSRFGRSLAAGDFNGDHNTDLLVGAPGQEAFIYLGPFPSGGTPTPIAITDTGGVDFGYAVAALNVDGNPGDEAIVADPQATVDGHDLAGRVTAYAFNAATMSMTVSKIYTDHNPESKANFGSTVNALKFCTSTPSAGAACPSARVLMIGAGNEIFVYYREGENIPMRMRDGKMVPDVRGP